MFGGDVLDKDPDERNRLEAFDDRKAVSPGNFKSHVAQLTRLRFGNTPNDLGISDEDLDEAYRRFDRDAVAYVDWYMDKYGLEDIRDPVRGIYTLGEKGPHRARD